MSSAHPSTMMFPLSALCLFEELGFRAPHPRSRPFALASGAVDAAVFAPRRFVSRVVLLAHPPICAWLRIVPGFAAPSERALCPVLSSLSGPVPCRSASPARARARVLTPADQRPSDMVGVLRLDLFRCPLMAAFDSVSYGFYPRSAERWMWMWSPTFGADSAIPGSHSQFMRT